jgi:predicted regulator of Ras-like GTPase activity (Roadblock/LC7/MglB family)
MTDVAALHDVLKPLVQYPGVRAAVLATLEGELVAAEPWPETSDAASAASAWAGGQATLVASYRRHLHLREFSVLLDETTTEAPCHFYVQQVGDVLLALLFEDRHTLGDARRLCRSAGPPLTSLLTIASR